MKASQNEIKISVIEYIMANNIEPENILVIDIVRAFQLSRYSGIRVLGTKMGEVMHRSYIKSSKFTPEHYEFIDYICRLVVDEYKKQSEI